MRGPRLGQDAGHALHAEEPQPVLVQVQLLQSRVPVERDSESLSAVRADALAAEDQHFQELVLSEHIGYLRRTRVSELCVRMHAELLEGIFADESDRFLDVLRFLDLHHP